MSLQHNALRANSSPLDGAPILDAPAAQPVEPLRLHERHILAAANLNPRLSPWRLHQILTGKQPVDDTAPMDRISDVFRKGLGEYLREAYDAAFSTFKNDVTFVPPFITRRPTIITEAGKLPVDSGAIIMIETPSRAGFEFGWKSNYDITIPLPVLARANLRMQIAKTEQAIIWVVADNGEINEFYPVYRDDRILADLKSACLKALEQANAGEEPAPDDADLPDYIEAHPNRGSNSIKVCEPGSAEATAMSDYLSIRREQQVADGNSKAAKAKLEKPKKVLLDALKQVPVLKIGDQLVTANTIRVAERIAKPYSFLRLDIKEIPKSDD